ncbi:mediator complex, subunit Med16 [Sphaerosporella brunnea]|uniref:Mediator of RNA polymerase II transcription subunit 16 n=1 Tax=Sphaerosporella brunnea TaxID=1250544 RepID=A0A5J5EZ18_9PEZI|nr:mediator complex, subunit Med16 [Sphaerosporella brunnea]
MDFGDDLFQDSPPTPSDSNPRIEGRLDDLRRGGCNQRIAWSKLGCIAIINAEGTGVETRHLACNPADGRWLLSPAYPIANVTRMHEGQKLQHVTWSSQGADLAVVDVFGRVSFYTVIVAINALQLVTMIPVEQDDDMSALAGFWWLPPERPYSLHAVMRTEAGFQYTSPTFRPQGPFHPLQNKAAAIGITRNGVVKLWYHDGISKFHAVSCELECIGSLDDLLTHASISPTWSKEGHVALAAYTQSQQLRVYRLSINWNVPPQPQQQQQQQPPQKPGITQLQAAPTLSVARIKVVDNAFPTDMPGCSRLMLTHLEVLGIMAGVPPAQTSPTILCVFSGRSEQRQPTTVISRWDLKESPNSLHPSFDQLGARRAGIPQKPMSELNLEKLDDIVIDKWVIGVSPVIMGTVIAFACSDGLIDFRDRMQLQQFSQQSGMTTKITNMIQAGFSFTAGEPCIDLVLSPNNTVAVRLGPDNDVHMAVMEFARGSVQVKENMEITCVALALQHAYSCSNYLNNDDLLLVARKYRSKEFNNTFLTEVHRALNLKMDFANSESPSERLVRNPLLQRCLSLQFALCFQGEQVKKQLPGKLAWATLHLRVASLAFALTLNSAQRQGNRPPGAPPSHVEDFRPEALQTLLGLVKWFMDMMSMIINDLFDLAKACRGRANDIAFVRQKMLESNTPALILTLASAPRAFLRYNCRSLKGLETSTGKQLHQGTLDEDQRTTFRSFKVPIESCAVKISQFERIMTDIDGTVRAAYHNVPEAERANAERLLFVNNELPAIFAAPVERLLSVTLPSLWKEINVSSLFFHNVAWLGFHDDVESMLYHKRHKIDAVRKVLLPLSGVRLRRCTRCCSVVEEAVMGKTLWLNNFNRMCLCGTLWMHLSPGGHG